MQLAHFFLMVYFLTPIFLGLSLILSYKFFPIDVEKCHTEQRPNSYQLYSKDTHELKGYLIGSLHSGLSEEELKPWNAQIEEMINQDVEHFYLEVILPMHWSKMTVGLDRVVYQEIEKAKNQNKTAKIYELENYPSQIAFLKSILFLGNASYRLPFDSLYYRAPAVCNFISWWTQSSWLLLNIIYQNLINPSFIKTWQNKNTQQLEQMRLAFLNNQTSFFTPEDVYRLNFINRDEYMIDSFDRFMKDSNHIDKKFCVIIGAGHVAATHGMFKLMSERYDLVPFEVYK